MLSINLKEEVQKVVSSEWSTFAEQHPHLAKVIDQTLMVEQATASLADDPEFRQALETAAVVGTATEAIFGTIRQFVQGWLRQLS